MSHRRLPHGWSREQHVCNPPREIYFTPYFGDIFECPHCHSSWVIYYFRPLDPNSYSRYEVKYKYLPPRSNLDD